MSFLFHVGDLLLDGKEPIDDSVDKIVSIYNRFLSKTIVPVFFRFYFFSAGELKKAKLTKLSFLIHSFLENSSL